MTAMVRKDPSYYDEAGFSFGEVVSFINGDVFDVVARRSLAMGDPFTVRKVNGWRVMYPDDPKKKILVDWSTMGQRMVDAEFFSDADDYLEQIRDASDRAKLLGVLGARPQYNATQLRVRGFLAGRVASGMIVGKVLDLTELFLPSWVGRTRDEIKQWINPRYGVMDEKKSLIKPWLKQKSTWQGIAAAFGAFGIVIYPEAIEQIVGGVFAVIAGVEMWKQELEELKDEDDVPTVKPG